MQTIETTLTHAAMALREGHSRDAMRLCEEAAAAARGSGDTLRLAYVLRHTADINSQLGLINLAAAQITEATHIYREHGSSRPLDLANAIRISALNEERQLVTVWREAKELYASLNVQAGVDEALQHMQRLSTSQLPKETQ
jgi:Flp pilus assembly secretin CpaC